VLEPLGKLGDFLSVQVDHVGMQQRWRFDSPVEARTKFSSLRLQPYGLILEDGAWNRL
jgi:hypothetical protein